MAVCNKMNSAADRSVDDDDDDSVHRLNYNVNQHR